MKILKNINRTFRQAKLNLLLNECRKKGVIIEKEEYLHEEVLGLKTNNNNFVKMHLINNGFRCWTSIWFNRKYNLAPKDFQIFVSINKIKNG